MRNARPVPGASAAGNSTAWKPENPTATPPVPQDYLTAIAALGGHHVSLQDCALCAAQRAAREAFAVLNGCWTAARPFTLTALARRMAHGGGDAPGLWDHHATLDHAEYYRTGRWPAAIVAHLYLPHTDPEPLAMAAHYGLALHRPPAPYASWHAPGLAHVVVYTRPGASVRWLPEQSDPRWAVRV